MSEPTLTLMASGAYRLLDADNPPTFANNTTRWTAYAAWPLDGMVGSFTIEEIDVEAATFGEARRVAEAALARDFEPGGAIRALEERVGLY